MQLNQTVFKDAVFGAEAEMSFSIDDDNSIIFDILRDKMYSNKIGSLCREVASNSRDANREAGRGDVAIEIEIVDPNKLAFVSDMCIIFRDNGIGISPDRMSNVFVKYASSTKRSTNSQTGGFGLGAKTPFAYTDTFTVVTVCNFQGKKMKYTYSAMIDSTRKGKMILFDSEPTNEATGTQIVVPIQQQDRAKFEYECIKSTMLWNVRPELINFDSIYTELTTIVDHEQFYIVEDQFNSLSDDSYFADIDGICYPVDRAALSIIDNGIGGKFKIIGKFAVGQLTISANREAVQYDKQTCDAMNQVFDQVKTYLIAQLNQLIIETPSYIQACYLIDSFIKNGTTLKDPTHLMLASAVRKADYYTKPILSDQRESLIKKVKWNGKKLINKLELKHHKVEIVSNPGAGKVNYFSLGDYRITQTWIDSPIYYMDARKNIRRNITIWTDQKRVDQKFLLITPNAKSSQKDIIDECIKLGFEYDMDIKFYSDVVMAESNSIEGSTYKPTETITIKVRRLSSGVNWSSDKLELHRENNMFWNLDNDQADSRKFCYVLVDKLTDLDYHSSLDYQKLQLINSIGARTVIAVNQRSYDRYINQMTDVPEAIAFADKLIKNNITKLTQYKINHYVQAIIDKVHPIIKIEVREILPKTLRKAIATNQLDNQVSLPLLDSIQVKLDIQGLRDKLRDNMDKYPMLAPYLRDIDGYYWRRLSDQEKQKHIDIVKNYIKLVG